MPRYLATMPRPPKLRKDAAETAWAVVQAAIGEGEKPEPPAKRAKHPEAVKRGKKGGKAKAWNQRRGAGE